VSRAVLKWVTDSGVEIVGGWRLCSLDGWLMNPSRRRPFFDLVLIMTDETSAVSQQLWFPNHSSPRLQVAVLGCSIIQFFSIHFQSKLHQPAERDLPLGEVPTTWHFSSDTSKLKTFNSDAAFFYSIFKFPSSAMLKPLKQMIYNWLKS